MKNKKLYSAINLRLSYTISAILQRLNYAELSYATIMLED